MQLNHTRLACYEACSKQYEHKFVLNTAIDADYVENTTNFHYGSVVHKIAEYVMLEKIKDGCEFDNLFNYIASLFEFEHMQEFKSEEFKGKMFLHFKLLLEFKSLNQIKTIATEIELKNDEFFGRIDAILEINKELCLVDYKTCSSFDILKPVQLHNDLQLNLYYNLAKTNYNITNVCHIDLFKPKHKLLAKDSNNYLNYATRISMEKTTNELLRVINVPVSKLNNTALERIFKIQHGINNKIYECNYQNCINKYRTKCQFYKTCNKE